jgi:hypothetical protein
LIAKLHAEISTFTVDARDAARELVCPQGVLHTHDWQPAEGCVNAVIAQLAERPVAPEVLLQDGVAAVILNRYITGQQKG